MYRMILMVAAVLGMLATAAVLMVRDWQQFRSAALIDSGEIRLWIAPGMSFDAVARQLETLGVGRRDWRWKLLGRLRQPRVQAGEYRIEPGLDVEDYCARPPPVMYSSTASLLWRAGRWLACVAPWLAIHACTRSPPTCLTGS